MNIAYALGRIFLPIIFIATGVQKFLNMPAFAKMLADTRLPIPEEIVPYIGSMSKYEALGYLLAAIEVICGLMILIGLKARWGALVLILYAACSIVFVHHFWDMDSASFTSNMNDALKYLAIIGGLLLLVVGGPNPNAMDRHV
jgi:putative oxidoreductase